MGFFRRKEKEQSVEPEKKQVLPAPPKRSLQELTHDRVLTAEGWQRRNLSKIIPKKPK
jgi:hypothetical protein